MKSTRFWFIVLIAVMICIVAGEIYLVYMNPYVLFVIAGLSAIMWKVMLKDSVEVPASDPNF